MTTTTLTFKAHAVSPALSATAITMAGMFGQLNNYFTSLAAHPDCHWEVCSFSVAAHPYHMVLKRKSGAPGRILFMGIVTSVTTNYNPQLFFATWTTANSWRVAFFPEATSDVPANLLSPSGDVFTNPGGSTGLGPVNNNYIGTYVWKLFSCVDGIVLRLAVPATSPVMHLVAGDMGENYLENAVPVAGWMAAFATAMQTTPNATSQGFMVNLAGAHLPLQMSLLPSLSYNGFTRDLATKRTAYFPLILGTPSATFEDIAGYKLRQLGRGPAPLVGNEILYSSGPIEESFAISESIADGFWLVNRKV